MDFIEDYLAFSQDCESPTLFLKWTAIAALSAVAQRKIWVDWGDLTWYPNLYIIMVGPPATRKGTAMSPMKNLLKELGTPLCANSIIREQFIHRFSECSVVATKSDDGSLIPHCSYAIWSEELTSFLGKNSEQLLNDLTDLYDCLNVWEYSTKHQGTDTINGTFLTILGAATPESLKRAVPYESIGTGFTSRVIFICAKEKRKKSACPSFASSQEGQYLRNQMKQQLANIFSLSGNFKGTLDFAKKYINLYENMETFCPFDPEHFSHYWDRRMQNFMKLCMLVALSRGAGLEGENLTLTSDDFDRSLSYLEEAESEMPFVFADFGRAKQAATFTKVMNILSQMGEITYVDLLRKMYKDATDFELKQCIDTLTKAGLIYFINGSSGGRLVWKGGK